MTIMEAIKQRRSIRKYKPDPVNWWNMPAIYVSLSLHLAS
jgi:hypothetical protein